MNKESLDKWRNEQIENTNEVYRERLKAVMRKDRNLAEIRYEKQKVFNTARAENLVLTLCDIYEISSSQARELIINNINLDYEIDENTVGGCMILNAIGRLRYTDYHKRII